MSNNMNSMNNNMNAEKKEDTLLFTMLLEEMEKIMKKYSETNNKNYEMQLQIHETTEKVKQGKEKLVKMASQIDSENMEIANLMEELARTKEGYYRVLDEKEKVNEE